MKSWRTTTAGLIGFAMSIIDSATAGHIQYMHLSIGLSLLAIGILSRDSAE